MQVPRISKKFALVAIAVAGIAGVSAAQAGGLAPAPAVRAVQYADLDLNTAAGAQVLYRRLHAAAVQVCGDVHSRELDQAAAAQACVNRAIASSVRAVDREQLTRTANAHGYDVTSRVSVASIR